MEVRRCCKYNTIPKCFALCYFLLEFLNVQYFILWLVVIIKVVSAVCVSVPA